MFNGIIFNVGEVKTVSKKTNSILIGIKTNLKLGVKDVGSSICCNGVCLTLTKIKKKLIYFYLSKETIDRSNYRHIKVGHKINLEKSIIYGQKISGNFTQGHVDTVAQIKKINFIDRSWRIRLKLKKTNYIKFLEEKASVTINGVSLTISSVSKKYFELNIIPHTLKLTNLKNLKVNDFVNVELDIFSKYMYKYNL